jgi:hypothetical protein
VRRGGTTFAWNVSWSETETARANGQIVGGGAETCRARRNLLCEAETPRARQRLLVRSGDSSCEAETRQRSHRLVEDLLGKPPLSSGLVEEASYRSETRRIAGDGLGKDPQSSSY